MYGLGFAIVGAYDSDLLSGIFSWLVLVVKVKGHLLHRIEDISLARHLGSADSTTAPARPDSGYGLAQRIFAATIWPMLAPPWKTYSVVVRTSARLLGKNMAGRPFISAPTL